MAPRDEIQWFYEHSSSEQAIDAFAASLSAGEPLGPAVLYAFSRIAMVSSESRRGFEGLRDRNPMLVEAVLRGSVVAEFPPPALVELEPQHLDMLWAEFFVTGETEPIYRIVGVLDRPDVVRSRLSAWLRSLGDGFWGRRTIDKYRPMLVRCLFPIDYERRVIEDGVDLDVHVALNAKNGNLKFEELPISLSRSDCLHLATKSAALWSLRALSAEHGRVAEICASEAVRSGGAARYLLRLENAR